MRPRLLFIKVASKFNCLAALSRADVVIYSADGKTDQMFIRRYKGDAKHKWPNKQRGRWRHCWLAGLLVALNTAGGTAGVTAGHTASC